MVQESRSIQHERQIRPTRFARRLESSILAVAGLLALASFGPLDAGGQAKRPVAAADDMPQFEVAAIKPSKRNDGHQSIHGSADRILIENYTLRDLIRSAYGLKTDSQILGGPDWLDKQPFDINAKIDDAEVGKMTKMDRVAKQRERNEMLQSLLAERFRLKVHVEQRTMPVYALVVGKSGAKLTPTSPATAAKGYHISTTNGRMTASATSMDAFAGDLDYRPETGGRMVINRTGLTGEYDFKLNWAQDNGDGTSTDPEFPGLFTALQEQLGLKLKPEKAPVEVIIVESASEPTPN